MASKVLFFERASGNFGRGYDRWHLISETNGTFSVEHLWRHPSATADGIEDAGVTIIPAGLFFASIKDQELLGALRRAVTVAVTGDIRLQIAAMQFASYAPPVFDPLATVVEWLGVCRARNLDRLMTFYDKAASLDCACTGEKLCSGAGELRLYWQKRLADSSLSTFALQDIWPLSDATVLDYVSHNNQLVRSFFYFAENGLIKHTRCGPIELAKAG